MILDERKNAGRILKKMARHYFLGGNKRWNRLERGQACSLAFLLYAPFEETAGVGFWLLQLELHSLGLHWVEIYDAGYTTLAWISIGSRNFLPVTCLVLIVELPAVWHLATTPRLVVVPIYGAGLDLLALRLHLP